MNGVRKRLATLSIVALLMLVAGCSSSLPNRDPRGEAFPLVVGQSLEKQRIELPTAFAGTPVVILIGYRQNAQFDIDRWLMGLVQAGLGARVVEVPAIPGLLPTMASGWIDDGMRSGIPREDWAAVITLYGEAARPVAEFTGTTNGRLARVVVIDGTGQVVWFDDTGYSVRKALEVAELIGELEPD